MSNFLTSSIGKKFIMSISGLFLMMFIVVHLGINLLLVFDDSGELFNLGANFMATNPAIRIMEPLLALGFIVHILWSLFVSFQNMKARPTGYNQSKNSSNWASRNMLILGSLIFVFLVMHVINFFYVIKFQPEMMPEAVVDGEHMHDTYTLVAGLFKTSIVYCILYVIGGALLGIHLGHGFWSSFQTIGFANKVWLKRLQVIGQIYAIIVAVGFAIIPLYFLIKF